MDQCGRAEVGPVLVAKRVPNGLAGPVSVGSTIPLTPPTLFPKTSSVQGYNKRSFLLSLFVAIFLACLLLFPRDDGLRHVGLAFLNAGSAPGSHLSLPKSWGEVYPFSYFEVLKDYDPWFGYDLTLTILASGLRHLPISPLLGQFLLIKTLSLVFSFLFFYLVFRRSGILDNIKDQDTFFIVYALLLLFTAMAFKRILCLRPFAFGTFFLLYAIGQRGILRGLLSSAVLAFFYPYLAWLYTVPVALVHFLKGDRRFALGTISFTALFLYFQPPSFWGFQLAIFRSDVMRGIIGPQIDEFASSMGILFLVYLVGFFIVYPWFSREAKKLDVVNLLIILYLVPSIKHVRYLIDLVLPLVFVSFGRQILMVLLAPYRELIARWKDTVARFREKRRLESAGAGRPRTRSGLKICLAVLYALVAILVIQWNHMEFSSLKRTRAALSVIPTGCLVLTHFNLQYRTLFVRPDLRLIPSCELGFPTDRIRKEYLDFLNEGKVLPLAKKTGAQYFVENKRMYIDPENGCFLRLAGKSGDLRIWEIRPFRDANPVPFDTI